MGEQAACVELSSRTARTKVLSGCRSVTMAAAVPTAARDSKRRRRKASSSGERVRGCQQRAARRCSGLHNGGRRDCGARCQADESAVARNEPFSSSSGTVTFSHVAGVRLYGSAAGLGSDG